MVFDTGLNLSNIHTTMAEKIELPQDFQEPEPKQTKTQKQNKRPVEDPYAPWNHRIKLLLKKIGEKSMGYRWMHDQEAKYFLKIGYWFGVGQIILSSFLSIMSSGTLIGMASDMDPDDGDEILVIATVCELCTSFILLVLIGIKEQSDFKGKANQHQRTAHMFAKIYRSIQEQMTLDIEERENDRIFLREKIQQYDLLMDGALEVRSGTMEKYITATENHDIYKPALIGDVDGIEIDMDDERQNKDSPDEHGKYEIERWLQNF